MTGEASFKNPRDPVYFLGEINHESVSNLIHQIRTRTPDEGTLDVILTSVGGLNSSALAFYSWLSRFVRKHNVRFIASSDVASAALTLFLASDRRAADPTAVFRFHALAPEIASGDPAVALFVRETNEKLVDLIVKRTKLKESMVRSLMEERIPLSGESLYLSGICNEKP